ncbi:hypothetical protein CASFOL_032228 [Castilleja foliolosa]|uniref:DUF4283 domain-containing protein n=1 Tax=Castilleja foliolosa TaxID=1961234 RepID=A0ABD3C1G7_9LAMI
MALSQVDKPPDIGKSEQRRSFAHVLTGGADGSRPRPSAGTGTSWFRLKPIAPNLRTPVFLENTKACIVSPLELEEAAKQLEFALVLKFTAGRPSLYYLRAHILKEWKLSAEPVISLIDARNVIITASLEDMVTVLSQDSKRILSSLFRVFRWHKDFDFSKDNSTVPVWVSLPKLPLVYMNPLFLERVGNILGKYLRADEKSVGMTNVMRARVCVEMDVAKPFTTQIWIGESKDIGFWQNIEYEGNNSFCSFCGLLGHGRGICRKLRLAKGKESLVPVPNKQKKNVEGEGTSVNHHENIQPQVQVGAVMQDNLNTMPEINPQPTDPNLTTPPQQPIIHTTPPTNQHSDNTLPNQKQPFNTSEKAKTHKDKTREGPSSRSNNRFAAFAEEVIDPIPAEKENISEEILTESQIKEVKEKIKELAELSFIQKEGIVQKPTITQQEDQPLEEEKGYFSEGYDGDPLGVPESLSAPSDEEWEIKEVRGKNRKRGAKTE